MLSLRGSTLQDWEGRIVVVLVLVLVLVLVVLVSGVRRSVFGTNIEHRSKVGSIGAEFDGEYDGQYQIGPKAVDN